MRVEDKMLKPAIPEYTRYPREFITYKWFRPILTVLLFYIFYTIFDTVLFLGVIYAPGSDFEGLMNMISGGYDTMDVATAPGVIINLGGTALMIPALALANLIAGGRTFKSYESSRGGWDFGIFFKCLLIAAVVIGIPIVCDEVFHYGKMNENTFPLAGVILLTILGPMQCIAEEYAFRAILMQTFGSWFKYVPISIILSAGVFCAMHPYNIIGVIEIFISGCMFGIAAWAARGIEASAAMHIVNNMAIFYCVGIGFGEISSEVDIRDLIISFTIEGVYVAVILLCRKRGMFDKVKKNDAAEWNAKVMAKRARRAAGGYVQVPQGYQMPPQGYQAPQQAPQGYQVPLQGYQAPQQAPQQYPQGYQVPQGYQAPPQDGSDGSNGNGR